MIGRRAWVTGRVQGVGFRNFVQREARRLGVRGYAKNLGEGRVEVLAAGKAQAVEELMGLVARGPRWAEVRQVEVKEAPMVNCEGFQIL